MADDQPFDFGMTHEKEWRRRLHSLSEFVHYGTRKHPPMIPGRATCHKSS